MIAAVWALASGLCYQNVGVMPSHGCASFKHHQLFDDCQDRILVLYMRACCSPRRSSLRHPGMVLTMDEQMMGSLIDGLFTKSWFIRMKIQGG